MIFLRIYKTLTSLLIRIHLAVFIKSILYLICLNFFIGFPSCGVQGLRAQGAAVSNQRDLGLQYCNASWRLQESRPAAVH